MARPVDHGPDAGGPPTFSGAVGEDADQRKIVNYVDSQHRAHSTIHDSRRGHRNRALLDSRADADAGGHLSESQPACNLRSAALWRDGPGADGELPGLVLRVS